MDLKPCGTRAAYRRHQRNGEEPCRPCKDAENEYQKAYQKSDAQKPLVAMRARRRRYGTDASTLAAMLVAQGGACAICREPIEDTFHVDHDHETNAVRGLLCPACNKGLGHFADDPDRLTAAAAYLAAARKENLSC